MLDLLKPFTSNDFQRLLASLPASHKYLSYTDCVLLVSYPARPSKAPKMVPKKGTSPTKYRKWGSPPTPHTPGPHRWGGSFCRGSNWLICTYSDRGGGRRKRKKKRKFYHLFLFGRARSGVGRDLYAQWNNQKQPVTMHTIQKGTSRGGRTSSGPSVEP